MLNLIELANLSELEFSVKKFKFCPKFFYKFSVKNIIKIFSNLNVDGQSEAVYFILKN